MFIKASRSEMGSLKSKSHMIDILFALALFCVFAVSALLVALVGARVYESIVENMNTNFDTRSSISYISTKIRQNDELGSVVVADIDGKPALLMEQVIGDTTYNTWIYHHDGALKEIFAASDANLDLETGKSIIEIEEFSIEQVRIGLFKISAIDQRGVSVETFISTRTK